MSKNELKYIRVLTVLGLIVTILFFLSGSVGIWMSGVLRESDRIKVTDENREQITSLMEETIASLNETWEPFLEGDGFDVPDVSRAKEIDCKIGWHDYQITIYYEDGTEHFFAIRGGEPLIAHIQKEGYKYNAYFRSSEFVRDLIKVIIPLIVIVVAIILLRKINTVIIRKFTYGEKKYVGIGNNAEGLDN